MADIKLYLYDYLAVGSEAWTGFEGTFTVEIKSEINLGDYLRLRHLVAAQSEINLTDVLKWVMIFSDELALSSTVESVQIANPASIVELIDSLDMWSEIPLQSSVVVLADELTLDLIDIFVESIVALTDDLVLTAPERQPLKWGKVTPSTPSWTKVTV